MEFENASRLRRGASFQFQLAELFALTAGAADPENWIATTPSGLAWASTAGVPTSGLPDLSIAIVDPLALAYSGNNPAVAQVPPAAYALPGAPVIARVTLTSIQTDNPRTLLPMVYQLAERRFRGGDDLLFSRPDDGGRPQALPGPEPEADGDFSYALCVRNRTTVDVDGGVSFEQAVPLVDALVFAKRDLELTGALVADPPGERMTFADIVGGMFGGEFSVVLRSPSASWLKVRRGEWLLLSVPMTDATAPGGKRTFAAWYLIQAVNGSSLTLRGADFPPMGTGWADQDANTAAPTVYATIFNGLALVTTAEVGR